MVDKTTPKSEPSWTPFDMLPKRVVLRGMCDCYYDWQRFNLAAKSRGIHVPTSKEREKALIALADGQPLPKKGPRKGGASIHLLPEHLDRMEILAKRGDALLKDYEKDIKLYTKQFKAGRWLLGIDGVGPLMAGFIISHFDPYKAARPSAYWSFAGLNVVPTSDGRGRSPRREKGVVNTFSMNVRAKMLGVLPANLLRGCIRNIDGKDDAEIDALVEKGWKLKDTIRGKKLIRGPYVERFWDHMWYLNTRGDFDTAWGYEACSTCKSESKHSTTEVPTAYKDGACPQCSAGPDKAIRAGKDKHVLNTCNRVMVKQLLADAWKQMRLEENLPVPDMLTYIEQKRGRAHGA